MKIMEQFNLKGKVAIITGAGNGIGKASALKLAEAGADVVCSDMVLSKAEETANEARKMGVKSIAVKCDVTNEKDLQKLVDTTVDYFGKINILFNNAGGGGKDERFENLTLEYIQSIYNLNVYSKFTLMKLCAPYMKKDGYGSIINISSMASISAEPNMSVYGSSRAAINQLTKYAAFDLGPEIRVNAVGPGAIKTDSLETVLTPEIEEKMLLHTPLKRLGVPGDIASAVLFLASPASSWISGQILFVNGGGTQSLD